ncbi:MAG: protein of unknown function, putative recB domain [Thermoleophilia bacterium]|nr:protein of unknown function, putative recB domain [Thermoleophilia bacterium]
MPARAFSPSRLVAATQCSFKPRAEAFHERGVFGVLQLGGVEAIDDAAGRAAAGDDFEERLMERIQLHAATRHGAAGFAQLIGDELAQRPKGGLEGAAPETLARMRAGVRIIAQAPLYGVLDGAAWHGVADLLVRTDDAGAPALDTPWRYEVVDIKLARNAKAAHIAQLALYAELLDEVQGPWPEDARRGERLGLITGGARTGDILAPDDENRDVEWHLRAGAAALGRLQRRRYIQRFAAAEELAEQCSAGEAAPTLEQAWGSQYPQPVDHCQHCWFQTACEARRDDDSHASRVARLSGTQRAGMRAAHVTGSAVLGELTISDVATVGGGKPDSDATQAEVRRLVQAAHNDGVTGVSVPGILRAQRQAKIQLEETTLGRPVCHTVPPTEHDQPELRGFARLPERSRFDLFLDLEGYPNGGLAEAAPEDEDPTVTPAPGIDYLWGITTVDQLTPGLAWRDAVEPDAPTPDVHGGVPHEEHLVGTPADPARQPGWEAWWAHTPHDERLALEAVIDRTHAARAQAEAAGEPAAHVYHYGHYEVTRLKQLTSRYGTREAELTELLRAGAFINLYDIARDVVRIGARSYSIKDLEAHYRPAKREGTLGSGTSAILYYRRFVETPAELRTDEHEQLLREIAHYNRDDCVSTWQLREWLLSLDNVAGWPPAPVGIGPAADEDPDEQPWKRKQREDRAARRERMVQLAAELVEHIAPELRPETDADLRELAPDDRVRWLMSGLLRFHMVESNTEWWDFFAREAMDDDQRFRDQAVLVGLRIVGEPQLDAEKGYYRATYTFDRQPARERDLAQVSSLDLHVDRQLSLDADLSLDRSEVTLTMSKGQADKLGVAAPRRLLTQLAAVHAQVSPIPTDSLEQRLLEIAEQLQAGRIEDPVVRAVLERELPRAGQAAGADLVDGSSDLVPQLVQRAGQLDGSYLAVQGPPGTGKTYSSSRMICAAIMAQREGGDERQRIGVMGPSNAVVDHLIVGVAEAWAELYPDAEPLRVLRKRGVSHSDESIERLAAKVEAQGACFACTDGGETVGKWTVGRSQPHKGVHFDLIGGTAWLFASPKFAEPITTVTGTDKPLSHLFVDEAGQLTMASLLPAAAAAERVVLVGDPQQLPQVTKGSHPAGANVSALRHVMGDARTIDPSRGVLLDTTRRMHPAICEYVSRTTYEGQLRAAREPGSCDTSAQRIVAPPLIVGTEAGCVWSPVEHTSCATKSVEEGDRIVELCEALLGLEAIDQRGDTFTLEPKHFLVIAPYNDQVDLLRERLAPLGISEVGTVDRFQGREAPVAICSLTSSTRDRAPRGIGFLLDPNRLNVAVSRARTLSIVVGSPHLLESTAKTVEDVERLNALAAFVEEAR